MLRVKSGIFSIYSVKKWPFLNPFQSWIFRNHILILFLDWTNLDGYSLVYLSSVTSVVDTSTLLPSNWVGKIYLVGYTLSFLGNGDLKSGGDVWRILSNVMSLHGTFLVTLSISYIIPVLDAVIKKRTLSAYIHQLGKTPTDLLRNCWNGKDFSILHDQFQSLHTMYWNTVKDISLIPFYDIFIVKK